MYICSRPFSTVPFRVFCARLLPVWKKCAILAKGDKKMTFSEKLSALMSVTDVSCAALARALDVDRSTVSRFRSGTRGLPKLDTVRKMSVYLARNTSGFFRLNAIAELVGMPPFAQRRRTTAYRHNLRLLTSRRPRRPQPSGSFEIIACICPAKDVSESVREWVAVVRDNSFAYITQRGKRRRCWI